MTRVLTFAFTEESTGESRDDVIFDLSVIKGVTYVTYVYPEHFISAVSRMLFVYVEEKCMNEVANLLSTYDAVQHVCVPTERKLV